MSTFFENYNSDEVISYMNETFDVINEANVVRLDKMTMKKKMVRRAELAAAKAADDPLFHKYVKHSKLRKQYRRQIHEKYNSKANIIYKQWVASNKVH